MLVYLIEKPSKAFKRRLLVNVLAVVVPSPVAVQIVRADAPVSPTPVPAEEGPFTTKIDVFITCAARFM